MKPHLGRRVHDLLDGRLPREQTYAAMAHVTECGECARLWHDLREAREALNSSDAGIDMSFAQQLLDRERMAQVASHEPTHRRKAAAGRSRTPLLAGVSAMVVVLSTLTVAYVLGAPTHVALEFVAAPAPGTAQTVSYYGPDSMRSPSQLRSWIHPDWNESGLVPVEARVVQRAGQPVLVVSLLSDLHTIEVTEQHGRLHPSAKADLPAHVVGDTTVFVVSYDLPAVVWESTDVVLSASCTCPVDVLEDVVDAFPDDGEGGFLDRIAAGFDYLADLVTGK